MTFDQQSDLQRLGRDPGLAPAIALCPKVLRIGAPTYIPLYLTRYRLDAKNKPMMVPPADHVDLRPHFDAAKNWTESVNPILHCDGR